MPVRTEAAMGTVVTIQVVRSSAAADTAIDRAFGWFYEIEERCSRFNTHSELSRLSSRLFSTPGVALEASAILFEAVQFALLLAAESGGAFDPTVGNAMRARGFDREYSSGAIVEPLHQPDDEVSFRDVVIDADRKTILFRRPLTLDLGAVVKGLAVDLAARELAPFEDFAIDAGGDLYLGGRNERGAPWTVGIRHPRRDNEVIASLQISNQAVCTSGDYERRGESGDGHILDPRVGETSNVVASVTVVASGAMLADALSTTAFVLGPTAGLEFLDRMGVEGLILTPDLQRFETRGLSYAA